MGVAAVEMTQSHVHQCGGCGVAALAESDSAGDMAAELQQRRGQQQQQQRLSSKWMQPPQRVCAVVERCRCAAAALLHTSERGGFQLTRTPVHPSAVLLSSIRVLVSCVRRCAQLAIHVTVGLSPPPLCS